IRAGARASRDRRAGGAGRGAHPLLRRHRRGPHPARIPRRGPLAQQAAGAQPVGLWLPARLAVAASATGVRLPLGHRRSLAGAAARARIAVPAAGLRGRLRAPHRTHFHYLVFPAAATRPGRRARWRAAPPGAADLAAQPLRPAAALAGAAAVPDGHVRYGGGAQGPATRRLPAQGSRRPPLRAGRRDQRRRAHRSFRRAGQRLSTRQVLSLKDDSMTAPVLVCGSMAFDTIAVFDGKCKDHILPDRIQSLSVSFLVPAMRKEYGGCAGNIAYNMKLLGGHPVPVATVGDDAAEYLDRFAGLGIDVSRLRVMPGTFTAQCFITTDLEDNQIAAFH